jgi:hypothetical protein
VYAESAIAIVFYSVCADQSFLCVFTKGSSKCSECTCRGVRYNNNFSAETFDRLKAEKQRLKAARKHALERAYYKSAEIISLNR